METSRRVWERGGTGFMRAMFLRVGQYRSERRRLSVSSRYYWRYSELGCRDLM